MGNDFLAAALAYAQAGYKVFPLHGFRDGRCTCRKGAACEDAGKHPCTWHGLKDATTDEATIRVWWAHWPEANIGLPVPSDKVVFDVDTHKGGNLDWMGLELANTIAETGGGGNHVWYTVPQGAKVRKPAGVDTIRYGGSNYVVAPPSVHKSGKRYRWREGHGLLESEPGPIPAHLLEQMPPGRAESSENAPVAAEGTSVATPVGQKLLDKALGEGRAGNRNETGLWLAQQLRDTARLSKHEAGRVLLAYQAAVTRRGDHPYTKEEALRTLDQVYDRQEAREPAREQFPALTPGPSDSLRDAAQPDDWYVSQWENNPAQRELMRRARKADALPNEGIRTYKDSAPQQRRQAQFSVLKHVWALRFPDDRLPVQQMSTWLREVEKTQGAGDELTMLLDALFNALEAPHDKELRHPRAWFNAVVFNACEPPKSHRVASSPPVAEDEEVK
jgi:hypothetical protein